jgi:hypothetical protein
VQIAILPNQPLLYSVGESKDEAGKLQKIGTTKTVAFPNK